MEQTKCKWFYSKGNGYCMARHENCNCGGINCEDDRYFNAPLKTVHELQGSDLHERMKRYLDNYLLIRKESNRYEKMLKELNEANKEEYFKYLDENESTVGDIR